MHGLKVMAVDLDGVAEEIVEVTGHPSGLGWTPDGRLMVVAMEERRLLRLDDDGLSEVVKLDAFAPWHCNDMVVDATGRAYVGNLGYDIFGGGPQRTTTLVLVDLEGRARVAAADLAIPNGMVITPDGSTLIVGESGAARLTAFDVGADGSLSGRRVWAELAPATADGICLDAEGAVWIASPISNRVLRVVEGGAVTGEVSTGDRRAIACMLGGPDRRTLFVCTATAFAPEDCVERRDAAIETVGVDVPGAGWP